MESDPDELVDILGISSRELMLAFPKKVWRYVEEESHVEDEEEGDIL